MKYSTFNGWKLQGRVVMQGEKGQFRNEYGDKMFARNQTTPIGGIERITVYRDTRGRFVKQIIETSY
jgi:hypothetical protein